MSELSPEFVKRGYWVNLSQGSIMGKTITTDTKTGAIVIAILAVCTTLASSHLWHIVTFTIHQARADGKSHEGLYRQQQALLRTLPAPSSLMADSFKLFFTWRKTRASRSNLGSSVMQFSVALLFTIGSLVASIFSSLAVTSANIEVLVKSPYCGLIGLKDGNEIPDSTYFGKVLDVSTQHADECYQDGASTPSRCNVFVQPKIPFSMENTSCPFSPEMCASPTVTFDSGLLDLNEHFGMNLPSQDRMKLRRRTSCAILNTENRTKIVKPSDLPPSYMVHPLFPEDQVLIYYVGSRRGDRLMPNATFGFALSQANWSTTYAMLGITFYDDRPEKTHDPLPEMLRTDADVVVETIRTAGIKYDTPVNDPFFSAHRSTVSLDIGNVKNITVYSPDEPVSALGCTQQYQYCFSNSSGGESCTSLNSLPWKDSELANHVQLPLSQLFRYVGIRTSMSSMRSLNASSLVSPSGFVEKLPDDQWIIEVRRWVSLQWAAYQTAISDYAIGPKVRDSGTESLYDFPPPTKGGRKLCGMQKMRKGGGFMNINVFALSFVITFAVIVTLLDISLLRFMIFMSKFRAALSPKIDRWIQDGVFQYQRRAYEAQGQGLWRKLETDIPIESDSVKLPDLPIKTLPLLRGPTLTVSISSSLSSAPPKEAKDCQDATAMQISAAASVCQDKQ